MRHLLVTNDYPPKVGGIQYYLWEIYRRLPPEEVVVLTRPHRGWEAFDAAQDHQVIRTRQPLLLPEPWLAREINQVVDAEGIDLVMYDPAVPVGALGPRLSHPYGVILHGAEVTVPGRLPLSRQLLGAVLRGSTLVVTAGEYSTREAERAAGQPLPVVVVPPGVDTDRFRPIDPARRAEVRATYGIGPDDPVVLTLSRLVPRKGMDVLIDAVGELAGTVADLTLLVAGSGRDRHRLERRAARAGAPVRFLDRVPDDDKPDLYAIADVFSMLCRVRWGGLEQEGFGIVFVEAAAAGVPQLAGRSGGSAEAVDDGATGRVVTDSRDVAEVVELLGAMLAERDTRRTMAEASRARAITEFSYDLLADRFQGAMQAAVRGLASASSEGATP